MTALWKHQEDAVAFALDRPATLCCVGMGGGKSKIAITLADIWRCHRVLIVCPTTCRPVWRRELGKHAERDYDVVILDRCSVAKRTAWAAACCESDKPVVVVVNYEASWREPFQSWSLAQHWDLIILDESHRVMRTSRTSEHARKLHDVSDLRLCLSGTPLTQDPISVWGQCRFLDPEVFGEDLEEFKQEYEATHGIACRKANLSLNRTLAKYKPDVRPFAFPDWLYSGTINTDDYLERLSQLAFRVENLNLDLPPLQVERRTFRLSRRARRLYDEVLGQHGPELESGRWADIKGSYSVTMRLQQITSGWMPEKDGTIVTLDTGKAECLEQILREAGGEPVVVFGRFVHDLDITQTIAERLGLRYGEISQRRKDGLSRLGEMPEGLQVVGVQEQAGGAGIDLTRARVGVDYSPSWSLPNYDQKVARIHRPPQKLPVILYQLVAENSIDEEIHFALQARREVIGYAWKGLAETVSQPA